MLIKSAVQNVVIFNESALSVISDNMQSYEPLDALNDNPMDFVISDEIVEQYEYDAFMDAFTIEYKDCTVNIEILENSSVWIFSDKRYITAQNIANIADCLDSVVFN